jgi:D-tagatose-1,6-bisphosphate aldolase subunit GatZ/KbaZ
MYLDEIVAAQKQGGARGITSVCSAHPDVIKQTLKVSQTFRVSPLIEATCNQVNQYGGYTGMAPKDFVTYVRRIAEENNFPFANIILGGDHLGPNVWQNKPAESAMQKAEVLIHEYVQAGFTKIHLDCSMKLADDPGGALDAEVVAERSARLAKVAETALTPSPYPFQGEGNLRYVIGTEVPSPGGATAHEESVSVTKVDDVRQTIHATRDAFYHADLQSAWERVIAVVVQPGVEFGDDFVLPYQSAATRDLSQFIESQTMIYEAHSTDYQTRQALRDLVRDHFGILKVGPGLTFAFREAIFLLARIEDDSFPVAERSNIVQVLDDVMVKHPEHWKKYYQGGAEEQAFKRKFSLSDRIRYYWVQPEVQQALKKLKKNLDGREIPNTLLGQYVPFEVDKSSVFESVISRKTSNVLNDYLSACGYESSL